MNDNDDRFGHRAGVRQRFFPSDTRVVEHPPGYTSADFYELGNQLKRLTDSFQKYREESLSPGSLYEQWYNPSASAGPSPLGVGTLLEDHDLGFPCHAVMVDNPTSQWLLIEPSNRWVPPYTLGRIDAVISGGQNARLYARTPPGLLAFAAVAGERAYVAWHEAYLRPSPGHTVAANQISGIPSAGAAAGLPAGATPVEAGSGNVANGVATASLPAAVGKTTYITGFEITSDGATAVAVVRATVGVLVGGVTEGYTYTAVAGATTQDLTLVVQYARGLPGNAVNTAISVSLPALGAGNTNAEVNAHGYQL